MEASKLVGIPYETHGRSLSAADCWGIAYLFHDGNIPEYGTTYDCADNLDSTCKAISENKSDWTNVPVEKAVAGDIIIFNIKGMPVHAGVVIGGGRMIHTLRGHNSCIERYDTHKWLTRIEGIYRWQS